MRFYTKENALLGEKYYQGKHETGLKVVIIPKFKRILTGFIMGWEKKAVGHR